MAWNDGYVTEVPYTYGYYADLSPSRVGLALTLAGYAPIPPGPCCELGFGQGVCLAFSASAGSAHAPRPAARFRQRSLRMRIIGIRFSTQRPRTSSIHPTRTETMTSTWSI